MCNSFTCWRLHVGVAGKGGVGVAWGEMVAQWPDNAGGSRVGMGALGKGTSDQQFCSWRTFPDKGCYRGKCAQDIVADSMGGIG